MRQFNEVSKGAHAISAKNPESRWRSTRTMARVKMISPAWEGKSEISGEGALETRAGTLPEMHPNRVPVQKGRRSDSKRSLTGFGKLGGISPHDHGVYFHDTGARKLAPDGTRSRWL